MNDALIRELDQAALRRDGYGLGAVFGAKLEPASVCPVAPAVRK